jgi:DNA transposition AAA+ family ATPase
MNLHKIVPLPNIINGMGMIDRLSPHQPIGLIYGGAGLGKTSLAKAIAGKKGSTVVIVRACAAWRVARGMMLADVLTALNAGWGVEWHSTQFLYRQLLAELKRQPGVILWVDEADYLARGKRHDLLDTIRDLTDQADVRVVFSSIGSLARLLTSPSDELLQAVTSRVGGMVEFKRASLADASRLAEELIESVRFERDVISHCHRASNGSVRVLLGLFAQFEQRAHDAKLDILRLSDCIDLGIIDRPTVSQSEQSMKPVSRTADLDHRHVRGVA